MQELHVCDKLCHNRGLTCFGDEEGAWLLVLEPGQQVHILKRIPLTFKFKHCDKSRRYAVVNAFETTLDIIDIISPQ